MSDEEKAEVIGFLIHKGFRIYDGDEKACKLCQDIWVKINKLPAGVWGGIVKDAVDEVEKEECYTVIEDDCGRNVMDVKCGKGYVTEYCCEKHAKEFYKKMGKYT